MPFGSLMDAETALRSAAGCAEVISVGDVVSLTCLESGLRPKLMVFDYRTKRADMARLRGRVERLDGTQSRVGNPAGQITVELVRELERALARHGPTNLQVDGEEDMATLVCAALAPEGSCLLYGLPGEGIVFVRVDGKVNERAKALIYQMEELN
jgi:uncharacterized protein (UPF0218 family)